MKMNELFTARYSDGRTAYEKPLEWIYDHQNGSNVEISPTIWIWKSSKSPIYFVDYVGDGIGCTLSTFSAYNQACDYADQIGNMNVSEFENWLVSVRWKEGA